MKVGDLVMIRQGSRSGTIAIVATIDPHPAGVVHALRADGSLWGYYKRDLWVINESR